MTARILFLFLAIGLMRCSPVYVTYSNQVEDRSLSDYSTFAFSKVDIDNQSAWQTQTENLERIKSLIAQEMEERGLQQVGSDPDLLVNLGVVITDEVQTRETDIRDAPPYIGTRNYRWESEEVVVREYNEGTLVMDVVDADANEMIWQGAVKSTLVEDQAKMEKRVDLAVTELFKRFPG